MSSEPVSNSDVFLWSLYDLGGDQKFVDVEDVFHKSFELAPQRLGWRTRPDLPDIKRCSKGMRDAEARSPKLLVKNGADERRLSVEGQKWIEDNFDRLALSLSQDRVVQAPKTRSSSRLLTSLDRSDLLKDWQSRRAIVGQKWQFAELLRCSPDSAPAIWNGRLEELRAAAYVADRSDLLEFLDCLAAERTEWF